MLNAKQSSYEAGLTFTQMTFSTPKHKSSDAKTDDSLIDYSDIREWTKEDFANSKRGQFYRPNSVLKKSTD